VGTFIRIIRYFAILISIFLVPLWMLTLTNENFISHIFVKIESVNNIPVLLQIILVELTIEILRIATIHTPNQLTSAMGLIATLILGQMAVEVGWFASEVLLFCSISSIGGFATPSYELSLANKIVKLILIVLVGLFGGAGFIIGVYLLIMFLGSISLFEVPYLYPLFPFDYDEYKKVIFRGISK
jgi:stage V sporulation protein AF